ncbi:MAG: 16S rRNA (cytosine(1402)-N(4))-methyltransferase RsmH [Fimbriimonas sp.]
MEPTPRHDPVMIEEMIADLRLKAGDVVVDGTLGLAGHSLRFAELIAPGGTLVGVDWDQSMLEIARGRLSLTADIQLRLVHSDFRSIREIMERLSLKANAICLDLGLNSAQIDDPTRGISFQKSGNLDMRMDRSTGEPASEMLNRLSANQLERIFWEYGNEKWSRRIAQVIVERRQIEPLETTQDLVDAILAAVPKGARDPRIHPATRVFQAVRIAVNRELEGLDRAIIEAASSLADNGTLTILSYHSGEDRIVKHTFQTLSDQGFVELHKKPVGPSMAEIARNPRSRSAKMRSIRRAEMPS